MSTQMCGRLTAIDGVYELGNRFAAHRFLVLSAAAITHALIVFLLWLGVVNAEWGLISDGSWQMLVWFWFFWPLSLAFDPAATLQRVSVTVVIGAAFLTPCMPTALAFRVWETGGFAL